MRISNSTDRFITKVTKSMIERDEYNAGLSYASRIGQEKGEARGVANMKKKFASRNKKIAKYLRSIGVSAANIATALATK